MIPPRRASLKGSQGAGMGSESGHASPFPFGFAASGDRLRTVFLRVAGAVGESRACVEVGRRERHARPGFARKFKMRDRMRLGATVATCGHGPRETGGPAPDSGCFAPVWASFGARSGGTRRR